MVEGGQLIAKEGLEPTVAYNVPPPPVDKTSEHHPANDLTESLATTLDRVVPLWKNEISPKILEGKTVLIAAHGNSLRALVKHLDDVDEGTIAELNIPTGTPLVYELDENLKPIPQANAIAPLKGRYLGDQDAIKARIEGVKITENFHPAFAPIAAQTQSRRGHNSHDLLRKLAVSDTEPSDDAAAPPAEVAVANPVVTNANSLHVEELPTMMQQQLMQQQLMQQNQAMQQQLMQQYQAMLQQNQATQQQLGYLTEATQHLTDLIQQQNVEPTQTAATRGARCLQALIISGQYSQQPPGMVGANKESSVLSSVELCDLRQTLREVQPDLVEAAMTALLSPKITEVLKEETKSGLVLSNTESTKWLPAYPLESAQNRRKPDLLTAHPLRISPSTSFGGKAMVSFRTNHQISGLIFGGLDMKRDSELYLTSLWEGKSKLGNLHQALGEMVDYVKCLGVKRRSLSIILYDMDGFVVGDSIDGVIRTLYHLVPWDAPGSRAVLKAYMTKHTTQQVVNAQNAMVDLRLRIASLAGGASAYLGGGSFGEVFCVENENGEMVALKVARSGHASFAKEYRRLKSAKHEGAPVVEVQAKAEWPLCAYTMTPVGSTMIKTSEACRELFCALRALHDSGWYHGDARYPNAIKTRDGDILWIDFLGGEHHHGQKEALVEDKITLALSFVGPLDDEKRSALSSELYGLHDSDDSDYSKSFGVVLALGKARGTLLEPRRGKRSELSRFKSVFGHN